MEQIIDAKNKEILKFKMITEDLVSRQRGGITTNLGKTDKFSL